MKAYITGATGCVGRNLIDVLLENNWEVISLHRKSSDLSKLDGCDIKCREVIFDDLDSVKWAINEKADAFFHVGADVSHNPKFHKRQYAFNVLGTENILNAARDKVKRFIFTSTGAVAACDGMSYEQIENVRSGYIKTKKISELMVKYSDLDAVILRPIIVIGKYDYNNYSNIFKLLKEGTLKVSFPGRLEFCHAADVAMAHLSAFENGINKETYYLGGEFTTWHDVLLRMCILINAKPPKPPCPNLVYYIYAYWSMMKQMITGKEALITPELVDLICSSRNDNCVPAGEHEKSKKALGYESRSINKELLDCYNWGKDLYF